LELVTWQYSTGEKSSLGGIGKHGNSYLRYMVVQVTKVQKIHTKRDKSLLGEWVARLEGGHHYVVLITLAKKIMRIW
jgi:transposase